VAKAQGVDFNQVLVRFALERIPYRMTQSQHADRFLLKGALLFKLWYDMPHRATRDADLLGFGASDLASVAETFRDIAAVADGRRYCIRPGLGHGRGNPQGGRLRRRPRDHRKRTGQGPLQDADLPVTAVVAPSSSSQRGPQPAVP
jgi:hypothetical protein